MERNQGNLSVEEAWEEYIDLRQYLRVVWRHRFMVVLVTLSAAVTAWLVSALVLPPVYEAKAVLMVMQPAEQRQTQVREEGLESVVSPVSRPPAMTVNTYVGQIETEALLARVIKRLNLDPVVYTPAGLAGMVQAQAVKDTDLIEIRVRNGDPKLAADIANALSQEFLAFISENNQTQMAKSVEFLEQQRQNVQKELAQVASALKEFNSKPRGVDLLQKEAEKRMSDLTDYQSQLNQAQVEMAQLEAARAQIAARLAQTPPTIKITKPASPEALALVEAMRREGGGEVLSGQQPSLTVTEEEVNPVYVNLQQALAEKEAAIAEKEAQMAGLRSVIAEVQKGLEQLQAELTAKATERSRLERQLKQLEEAEALLSQKITEAKVARAMNLGEASLLVVAPAEAPQLPVKPNRRLNTAVAAVLGLMASVLLAFAWEYFDRTVRETGDLERMGLAVLGTIPEASSR
ncbi:MAG: GumC family protein [Moorellales bacterium]